MWYEYFLDRGLITFPLVRYFINRLNGRTYNILKNITDEDRKVFSGLISKGPIANDTEIANQQDAESSYILAGEASSEGSDRGQDPGSHG